MNLKRQWVSICLLSVAAMLTACGGGGGSGGGTPAQTVAAITAQPTDQSVVAGTAATFTVTASNATGYQWQRSSDGGTTFADVSGATVASHTTPEKINGVKRSMGSDSIDLFVMLNSAQ